MSERLEMAGPTAGIILSNTISSEQVDEIRLEISKMASRVKGDEFWVHERPFILIIGPEYEDEFKDCKIEAVPEIIGWTSVDTIGFAAMCNDAIDHKILGELCLHFSRLLDGLIDFSGELNGHDDASSGRLFSMNYLAASGKSCIHHIGDAEFLEGWLKHPNFHMIK